MHAEDDDMESGDSLPRNGDEEYLENVQLSPELRAGVTREEVLDILDLLTSKKKLTPDIPLYRRLVLGKHVHTEKRDCRFLAEMLQLAIFSYKFDAASQILEEIISRPYRADQLVYKTGMFLIEAHPSSTPEKMNYFIRHCRCLRYADKKEMALEYIIYCLKKGDYKHLRTFFQSNLSVHKKIFRKSERIELILKGYLGILDYLEWVECIHSDENEQGPITAQGCETAIGENYRSLTCAARAAEHFKELLNYEGPFDIFILKYLEMQEYYSQIEEADVMLEEYVVKNPENLNAYIYHYTFLKRHNLKFEERLEHLQAICKMDPSNPLVLEYVELVNTSGLGLIELMKMLANFVDSFENKDSKDGWKWFCHLVLDAVQSEEPEIESFLHELWKSRSSYWIPYHFQRPKLSGTPETWVFKAAVLRVLNRSDKEFPSTVKEQLEESDNETLLELHKEYQQRARGKRKGRQRQF